MGLREVVKQLFTESDNQTHDIVRYLAVLSILSGLGLAFWDVIFNKTHFDVLNFGGGIAALFGGVGVALGLKKECQ